MNLKEQLDANNRCLVITIFNQLLATIDSFLMLNFKITSLQLNTTVYKTSRAEGSRGRRQRVVRGWNYCKLKNWERASLKKWMYNWWLHSTLSIYLCVLIVMFCFPYEPISSWSTATALIKSNQTFQRARY